MLKCLINILEETFLVVLKYKQTEVILYVWEFVKTFSYFLCCCLGNIVKTYSLELKSNQHHCRNVCDLETSLLGRLHYCYDM